MASLQARNKAAKHLSELIDPVAKEIMREWDLKFTQIQRKGLEPNFDREIIKRINANPRLKVKFIKFMLFVADNYGKIWDEFSEEQKDIITLKESKIFW